MAIRENALAFAVAHATVEEIDRLNILQATMLAMQRAVNALGVRPDEAWIDGNRCPKLACRVRAIVQGDRLHPVISAASILAKTARDALMVELCTQYPGYGFSQHKGYGSAAHLEALKRLGPSPAHRRTFAPVRALLEGAA